jgi:hypothetical protein
VSKSKQLVLSLVVLVLGIVMVNNILFPMAYNECLCWDEGKALRECINWCPQGECLMVSRSQGTDCVGANCASLWRVFCENGSMGYVWVYEWCSDCTNW